MGFIPKHVFQDTMDKVRCVLVLPVRTVPPHGLHFVPSLLVGGPEAMGSSWVGSGRIGPLQGSDLSGDHDKFLRHRKTLEKGRLVEEEALPPLTKEAWQE